jgi:hypothetical protein
MSHTNTPQKYFEKSIGILFLLGQLPVIFITYCLVLYVDKVHASADGTWYKTFLLFAAMFAISTSLGALLLRKRQQKNAVFLLTLSLLFTLGYLASLMMITGGRKSPFMHLFLYMPAIVYMVAERRIWAEALATAGAFLCFCWTYTPKDNWDSWSQFSLLKGFHLYEKLFILILLVLLIFVNHMIERLAGKTLAAPAGTQAAKS